MGGLFSKKKAAPPTAPPPPVQSTLTQAEAAQLELKRTRDRMRKYQTRLNGETISLTARAREALAAAKKDVAVRLLKLKKLRQDEIDKIENQISNLERLVIAIESEASNQAFLRALDAGNATLKKMQEALPLELAQSIMDSASDTMDAQAQIDEAFNSLIIGTSLGADASTDDALIAELDALTAASAGVQRVIVAGSGAATTVASAAAADASSASSLSSASSIATIQEFPSAPTHAPAIPAAGSKKPLTVIEEWDGSGSQAKRPKLAEAAS